MQYFYITQNSTLPTLRMELIEDGRHDYNKVFEALQAAHDNALPSEVVLLSPACASWDQFPDSEVRGKQFKEMVRGFKKG